MKAIFYAGLLAAAALVTMSCKQNTAPADEDTEINADIFQVEAKPAIEISPEDDAWETCKKTHPNQTKSKNFITKYIYKYKSFIAVLDRTVAGPENPNIEAELPPMDDYEWLDKAFETKAFYIDFHAKASETTEVAKDRQSNIFNAIAKQNNDVNYNGFCWNDFAVYSYIPTEYVNIECVQDYDAAHPAGTLLNDIATAGCVSAETFIRSGYKKLKAATQCGTTGQIFPLNEFNTKQVNMVEGLSFMVSLTQAPDVEGVYTFKLTYKDISGEVRTATTIPIRLAAK